MGTSRRATDEESLQSDISINETEHKFLVFKTMWLKV